MSKSKQYIHQPRPPKVYLELQKVNKALTDLQRDHETLQTALRMLTSTDKETLIKAVDSVKNKNIWWDTSLAPGAVVQTFTVTGTTMIGTNNITTVATTSDPLTAKVTR